MLSLTFESGMSSSAFPDGPPQAYDEDAEVIVPRPPAGVSVAVPSPEAVLEFAANVDTPWPSVSFNTEGTVLCLHDPRGFVLQSIFFLM